MREALDVAIKLVVLDIDGTIAGESNHVRPAVVEAIQRVQAQGIGVALATGRMFGSALRFHDRIQSTLPLITYNGGLTQHPHSQEVLRQWPLSTAIALGILDYFESPDLRHRLEVHCYHNDQLYVREITPDTERYMARSGMKAEVIGDLRIMIERGTVKLLAISENNVLIQRLITDLRQYYSPQEVHLSQSTEIYFEITHPYANKGLAIQHLTEEVLGLKAENVLAIGDNFNDREMIKYAGIGVAMGNAPDPIKAIADWVTDDVEVDGVKLALEKFCLSDV
ncbi:MAG: Cof-type HAD-IIB family hydrolase [Synechocystis sp.]